jgi:hypothetical protein
MNGAYQHLLLNHVPVIGFPICFLLLAAGAVRKSRDLVNAGLLGLVLFAIVATLALKTGGPAAGVLFHYPNVTLSRPAVHEHAEAGEKCTYLAWALGVLGLLGLVLAKKSGEAPKILVLLLILGTLAVSVGYGRVAHLGGLIRHPEIEATPAAAPAQ